MDISDFVKKAKEYNVLGIKISKDNLCYPIVNP